MKNSSYTMVVIEPETESNYLTQKDSNISINDRIYSKKIYLAVNDSSDNYIEIDEATYQNYQTQLKDYEDEMKKQMESGNTERV